MAEKPKGITIDPSELIAKLDTLKNECDGDLAKVVERLLLENHVLQLTQSKGMLRGAPIDFNKFPRFLEIIDLGSVAD